MPEYSYLDIALRGESQGATRTLYSYPSAGGEVDPRWDSTLVEPAAAIKRFLNASDCYILQSTPRGHYFSLITRNTINPERGYMMISVLVHDGCALSGRQLIHLFNNLRKTFIEDETLTDEAVDEALAAAAVPTEPVRLEAWQYHLPPDDVKEAEAAYRTYISQQELESIFSFPCQPDYAGYRCVIVVSATASLRPGAKMPRLTVPIRRLYSVVCPEGVSVSSTQVYDGDRLAISYIKEGFNTHTENVIVGTPSAYTKNEGSTLLIRSASQTGIRFERRVPFKVLSSKGAAVNGFTITLNGRPVNTMEPTIEFLEKDLMPDTDVEISVKSTNYQPLKIVRPAAEILETEELEFVMQPIEQGVTLRLDFGDGRVFEQQISIEKNTSEYNRLHSGNFHGFRAHRQITKDDSEVYNVDVRITSRPVAPNFEAARGETPSEPARKAPKFVNVSDEAKADRPEVDTTLPVVDETLAEVTEAAKPSHAHVRVKPTFSSDYEPEETDDDEDDDDLTAATRSWYRRPVVVWIGVALIAAVIGLVCLLPQYTGSPSDPAPAEQFAADAASEPTPAPAAAVTPEEKADIDYLNSSPVWDTKKMQSPMGQSLMAAIADGDIDSVVGNDYFAVEGRCTNEKAILFADLIWRAKGSPNERGNRRTMRLAADKNGSIDLKKFTDDLAKSRPSEKINESPRPKK